MAHRSPTGRAAFFSTFAIMRASVTSMLPAAAHSPTLLEEPAAMLALCTVAIAASTKLVVRTQECAVPQRSNQPRLGAWERFSTRYRRSIGGPTGIRCRLHNGASRSRMMLSMRDPRAVPPVIRADHTARSWVSRCIKRPNRLFSGTRRITSWHLKKYVSKTSSGTRIYGVEPVASVSGVAGAGAKGWTPAMASA